MRDTLAGLRLALGTFTTVPIGALPPLTSAHAKRSMLLAPVAALPVAAAVSLTAWGMHLAGLAPLACAFLAVGVSAYLTRGMHIDGLADTVDGFGAGWTRERALSVMKSGDVGPMGVAALIVTMAVQASCLAALIKYPWLVAVAWAMGRAGCMWVAALLPAAREDGMGALMARCASLFAVSTATLIYAAVLTLSVLTTPLPLWAIGVSLGFAVVVVAWLTRRASRIIGGSSGDVFGASVEMTTTALLVGLAIGATHT